ncbi:MAG: hypothetical protein ACI9XK_004136 [Granulosicoccus sp.]|jgi:hypothetical protein
MAIPDSFTEVTQLDVACLDADSGWKPKQRLFL